MALFLYITILIFEVIYYSLFMKFARKEGNLLRYLLMFIIITLVGIIINTNTVFSYIALIVMITLGLKYFVKIKVSLFDILVIFFMVLMKMFIELPIYAIFHNKLDIFTIGIIYSIFKILFVMVIKNKLNTIYNKLYKLWKNNNFYIRYIFTVIMFIYTIVSSVFIIFYYI